MVFVLHGQAFGYAQGICVFRYLLQWSSTESSASSPSDSESNSKLSAMEVIDGNDGVLAAGIAVAATMQLFVCTPETSHVGTNRTHIVLKTSPQENAHLTIYQGASGREKRSNE